MGNEYPTVFSIGNPLIDIIINVTDNDILNLGLDKGTMRLLDKNDQAEIIKYFKNAEIEFYPGGSAPNTTIACSGLGIPSLISGKIGKDDFGDKYLNQLKKYGVLSGLVQGEHPTGTSIVLITPDGERTMNTYLGSCRDYCTDDIDTDKLIKASFLYFTGYMWDTESQKNAIQKAIAIARNENIKIGFDVADPFVVERNKNEFLKLIERYVDIVFANQTELSILFDSNDIEFSIKQLMNLVKSGGIKLGKNGSIVFHNKKQYVINSQHIKAIDTTGAGDMYAAGFISSLSTNDDFHLAGKLGVSLAEEIIQIRGAQLDKSVMDRLKFKLF